MVQNTTLGQLRGAVRSVRNPASESDQLANPKVVAAALLLVVLLPLVPFLAVALTISRTLKGVRRRVSWE
ncbi:uncharacterized protein Nmlp_1261 [Natronomonas moolapensis 8.8.11]|uniref:Uncharacterized protein n=1 Tax=Natronomonas moolapensis (strain DSM 18674 / CECT 7526 / JCM 14361 / 8.8.11) TaxID=268739 RepID=M1XNI2_NATM8|nr:hypothetical protein [Natronomonas moolapensis]CCQ35470.1 uncharacterized protein Nmlp_1261 [Natronomonas moolapensis 8.8.11]